jgi:hypothetical protein
VLQVAGAYVHQPASPPPLELPDDEPLLDPPDDDPPDDDPPVVHVEPSQEVHGVVDST